LLDNFDDRYLGAKTSDPGLDNDGNALVLGALYFNSTDGVMKVYTASGWIAASSASVATLATFEFVATSGQTVFSGNDANGVSLSYVAPAIIVTLNGVRLRPGDDYTATNGTSLTLVSAAALNDELVVDAFGAFLVANTYTIAQTDAGFVDQTSATGAANLPSGTTGQRPGSPVAGMQRFNATTGYMEYYNGTSWEQIASPYQVEFLVVAGGGGGGADLGGGGGAGGYLAQSTTLMPITAYTVTIGAGGAGGTSPRETSSSFGKDGSNSVFGLFSAVGGGGGGTYWNGNATYETGRAGGSGGGGGGGVTSTTGAPGTGTAGQGNNGGRAYGGSPYYGAGGGGANAVGADATSSSGGNGGAGINWQSLGTTYGGGGGGSAYGTGSGTAFGTGGAGGGGNGGYGSSTNTTGGSGTANRGGGGGGAPYNSTVPAPGNGGAGGSGIVIIRYLGAQRGTGGTVTSAGGYTYHTFTSSGTFTG
jgi:hypothetical protein